MGVDALVWVDSWRQCCGEDFRVGSSVRWQVKTSDGADEWIELLLGPEWATTVRFAEDHHLDRADGVLTGTVSEINVVISDRVLGEARKPGPSGKVMVPVPGTGRLRRVETADRWEPEPRDLDGDWSFDGWIVKLDAARYEPDIESVVEDGRGAQASS
jgi:hypothetical protein